MTRVLGALVVLFSAALVGFSVYAVATASSMASGLAEVAEAFDQELDAADWRKHWLRASVLNGVLGVAGLASGIGLLWQRPWSKLLWSLTVTVALLSAVVVALAGTTYGFEGTEPVEWAVLVAATALSWCWYLRGRRRTPSHQS
jgi:hypothetical protein